MMNRIFWLVLLVAVPVLGQAQMVESNLAERLERLERRLMALEGRTLPARSDAPAGSALASMEQRLQQIEEEGRQINGGVERLSNAVEQLARRVDELAKDFDMRLRDLETATPQAAAGVQPVASESKAPVSRAAEPTTEVAVPEELSADEHYKRAYAYLTAADYTNAKLWLDEFLKRHPKHDLADNAYYWLGEVHLVRDDPKNAVVAFKRGLEAFPKGQKAPANLLKMGVALEQLKQPQLAKGTWEKLVKDYPKSAEAAKARTKLTELPKS